MNEAKVQEIAMDVHAGEHFSIDLAENPSTGYSWVFDDHDGLEVISSEVQMKGGGAGRGVGGGGKRHVVFHAEKPGQFALRARLWRVWIGDSSVEEIRKYTITAKALGEAGV